MGGCQSETETPEIDRDDDSIRVAAVGDSITAEYTTNAGYPEKLDEMLGEDYTVLNFGESNHAVQSSSDFPYEASDSYQKSLEFQPEIVVIMLGTNDTKAVNWQGQENFKAEYMNLVENYMALDSTSRVILVAPPTVFAEPTFRGSIDSAHIPAVREAVAETAEELNLEFIDMTAKTENRPEWFFDGIHPTPEGAEQIAEIIYNQISE